MNSLFIKKLLLGTILFIFLIGCSNQFEQFEGTIVQKSDVKGVGKEVLVIQGVSKEDIEKKEVREIIKENRGKNNSFFFSVDEESFPELKIGQKVRVYYDSEKEQLESDPPRKIGEKIEALN